MGKLAYDANGLHFAELFAQVGIDMVARQMDTVDCPDEWDETLMIEQKETN